MHRALIGSAVPALCAPADRVFLPAVDPVGSMRTRSHRKHSHLRHYSRLLPGLREQRRLQLAAVVKKPLDCSHMDSCRLLAVHAQERGGLDAESVASLWGVLGAPFFSLLYAYCFHRDLLRIKRIFSFGKAWLVSHFSRLCFPRCPAESKILTCFPCSVVLKSVCNVAHF